MSPGSYRMHSFSFFFYSSLTELFQSIYLFSDHWFYLLFGLICHSCTLLHFSFCLLNSSDSEFLLVLFKDLYLFIKFLILFSCPYFTELCLLRAHWGSSEELFWILYSLYCTVCFEFSYSGLLYFCGCVYLILYVPWSFALLFSHMNQHLLKSLSFDGT